LITSAAQAMTCNGDIRYMQAVTQDLVNDCNSLVIVGAYTLYMTVEIKIKVHTSRAYCH